ncbi:Ig-like domain-containing protein [Microvirga pakistanensis]|uniref:Ig-like domain-containing protein n=2 Tax=Microvirga pakistanensis TaxID=1682650 RepID=UPI001069B35D|nr:Ig-like domain-containing protein [Microvirga pakistanensis]
MTAPTTIIDAYSLDQGGTLRITDPLLGVLGNDSDADGDAMTAKLKWSTANGALNLNADGTFTYTPYNGFTGTDHFYYEADDGTGNLVLTEVAITVNPSTEGGTAGPAPAADTYDVTGTTLTVNAQDGVLANDGVAAGATAALQWNASFGTVTMQPDGSFSYQLADWAANHPRFTGTDEFFYTVNGESVKVALNVVPGTGGGSAPDANADTITLAHASGNSYSGSTVLANDANVDGLVPELVYSPGYGTVTLNADGTFTYVKADWADGAGFTGTDEFFYKVGDSEVVKVTVTVPAPTGGGDGEAAPIAQADTYDNVTLDGSRSFTSTVSLLANDTDANGDALTAVKQWNPGWGEVTVNADGTFTYTLADWATEANGFTGTDEFFYYAKDASGQSQLAKVTLTNIQAAPVVEEPPPADIGITVTHSGPDTVVGEDGTTDTISIVLKSKPTADVTVIVHEDPIAGVKADRTVTFTPDNWDVAQTVTLSATDNLAVDGTRDGLMYITASSADENYEGLIAADNFPVTVHDNDVEANEPPSAVWLNAEMSEDDQSVEVTPSASDWNGDQVTFRLVAQPEKGTVSYDEATGKFTFTPDAGAFDALNTGESETVTFQYVANDGQSDSDPATVTIKVNGVTDVVTPPPVLPEINATAAPGEVTEGGVANFTLTRTSDLSEALTVSIDADIGSAKSGSDFTAPATVTFAAGSAEATYSVQTTDDGAVEAAETIEFRILEGEGYKVGAGDGNVTELLDAPPAPTLPTISISDASASEGGNANFRLTLSEPPAERLTVTYQVIHGSTSTGDVSVGTYTLNIAAGFVGTRGFNVPTIEELAFEPDETFTVKLVSVKNPAGVDAYAIADGEGTGTILNDDADPNPPPAAEPGITLSKADLAVTEGGASETFTVVLDAPPTADVTVQVSTGNELMALGPNGNSDLVFTAANWNVPQTVTVRAEDDGVADGPMTDYVYFTTTSADARYDGMLTDVMTPVAITDAAPERPIPYVTVANLGGDVAEGGEMTFTFHRSEAGWDMPVLWEMAGLDASDIQAVKWNGQEGGYERFLGNSQTATMTIVLADDADIEETETVTVTVKPDAAYMYDEPYVATGNVLDNDTIVAQPVTVSVADVTVAEDLDFGPQMGFKVSLSAPATQDVIVHYEILSGTATDGEDWGQATTGTLTFMAGDQELTPVVNVFSDGDVEPNETIIFRITGVEGNATVVKGEAIGTIENDDVAAPPALSEVSVSAVDVTEGGDITYTFTRTNADAALDVAYTLGGTATAADFTAPSGTVQFAAGATTATVTVRTADDSTDESDETVVLTVTPNAASYTVAQGTASASILDNDEPVVPPPTDVNTTAVGGTRSYTGGSGSNDTLTLSNTGLVVGTNTINLDGTTVGTVQWAGGSIQEFENIKLTAVGGTGTLLAINGDEENNIITVGDMAGAGRTNKSVNINAGDGNDTINYIGTGPAAQQSVLSGGTGDDTVTVGSAAIIDDRVAAGASGNDTYDLGTNAGRQTIQFGADNGNDTVRNYSIGDATTLPDVLDFTTVDASTMVVTEADGNTIFTINGSQTVTVEGATGLVFGTHWTAKGTYTPPEEEPTGEAGVNVSKLNLNVAEGGATDSVDVVLTRKPISDVVIQVGSDGGVTTSAQELVFTPENWNTPQTLTVTANDDADYEGGEHFDMLYLDLRTSDPAYADVFAPYPSVSITDNDAAPEVAPPEAMAMSADVWEDNPVVELQGNGYSAGEFGITEYMIVSQPVEGGTVTFDGDRTFRFEGDKEFLSTLNRGETKPVTFEYAVKDSDGVWSAPATMTFNVHGFTNGADETYEAFTTSTPSQTDFLNLNGGDGNDTVVFKSITVTSGEDVSVGLDQAFHWTEYAGKSIVNTENLTIKDTAGDTARTMTVNGNDQANVLTIENSDHKLFVNGGGGNDTIDFKGTGNGVASIINGGAGDDTVNARSGAVVDVADGNDTVNVFNGGNVTVRNFSSGDKVSFAAGIQAGNVSSAVVGSNTVFTINQDGVTSTVTVEGATGLQAGTDWTAEGLTTPPAEPGSLVITEPAGGVVVGESLFYVPVKIRLSEAPTSDVTVTVDQSNPDLGIFREDVVLTFTPANWNVDQDVLVRAENDSLVEGTETHSLGFSTASQDARFDSLASSVSVTVTDDDGSANPDPEPTALADLNNFDGGHAQGGNSRSAQGEIINGDANSAQTIDGYGGNDTVYGRDLNDIIRGGAGNDTVYGGTGDDQLFGDGGGAGAINGDGRAGADHLYGGDGNDQINGQDGNDVIVGGHGADALIGGLGDDSFVFHDIFDRGDTVTMQGQAQANDVFDFRNFDFDPNTDGVQGAVNGLQFLAQKPLSGSMAEDTFYFDPTTGRVSLNTGTDGVEDFHFMVQAGNGSIVPVNKDDFLL